MRNLPLRVRWLAVVVALVVALCAAFSRQWWAAALWTGISLTAASRIIRNRPSAERAARSAAARTRWTPERVAEVTGAGGTVTEVEAVKALRRADKELSLLDAVELVREARSGRA